MLRSFSTRETIHFLSAKIPALQNKLGFIRDQCIDGDTFQELYEAALEKFVPNLGHRLAILKLKSCHFMGTPRAADMKNYFKVVILLIITEKFSNNGILLDLNSLMDIGKQEEVEVLPQLSWQEKW